MKEEQVEVEKEKDNSDNSAITNDGGYSSSRGSSTMKTSSSHHQNQGYGQSMSRPPVYDQGQSRLSMSSGVPELKYEIVYKPGPNGQSGHLKLTIVKCRVGFKTHIYSFSKVGNKHIFSRI